jgi:Ca-activated chloride channel family protein
LDTISQENRGASAYVQPDQAIDEAVSTFYQKISTPVLSSLTLDMGQAQIEDLYPYPLPDLFAGSQLVLAGRYRSDGPVAVTLRGLVNGQEKTYTFEDLTLRNDGGEPFIARLWATRKIGYLLNQIRLGGPSQELVDEIVRLSTTYGIATPYTSFFAPEPAVPMPMGDAGPMPTAAPAPQAVVEFEKQVGAAASEALSAAPSAPAAGEAAVQDSRAREALRSAEVVAAGEAARGLRTALDKAFAYQAGLWVDTAYRTDQPKRELAFGSDEYFDLLAEHPEWAAYLAVSPSLIVVLDGVAHVVLETGAPMSGAAAAPTVVTSQPAAPPPEPETIATEPPPVAVDQPNVGQPAAPPAAPLPFCAAPAFGVGLLLLPGMWAWRRRSR